MNEDNNEGAVTKFMAHVDLEGDAVYVDDEEIAVWEIANPQRFCRNKYQGLYGDPYGSIEKP